MHLIIPMSGEGRRFIEAGYQEPKPLIVIDNKPIIEHVSDLFPSDCKVTFICRKDHLQNTMMKEILSTIRPRAEIIAIDPHKLGPVWAVTQIFEQIDDDEEIIVNYCDFGTYWQYQDFIEHTRQRNAYGAIPSYKGFHPHMLGTTNYAFIKDCQQWLIEIREKQPFTDNRMAEFASNGTYYFKHGWLIKKYFQRLIDRQQSLNGEYYVSMVYNLLREDNLPVSIYEIQHMLQWGTPEDVAEYLVWSQYFKKLAEPPTKRSSLASGDITLIPMAGHGKRFQEQGYSLPKPLLPISGKPMVVQAVAGLPITKQLRFICLETHSKQYSLATTIQRFYPDAKIITIPEVTEGQAITCRKGLDNKIDTDAGLFIAACDNSMVFDIEYFEQLVRADSVDAIVFTFKNHPSVKRNPNMYGYVQVDNDENVTGVSVKIPVSLNPEKDHAIVGAFYFKSVALFEKAVAMLVEQKIQINNEYYVDSLIKVLSDLGYCIKPLVVDHYICWGTPDDLRTYEYWQSLFHKVDWHPYRLEFDVTLEVTALDELEQRAYSFGQEFS